MKKQSFLKVSKIYAFAILLLYSIGVKAESCPSGMVLIESFCLDKHEVTNIEYQKNTGKAPYTGAQGYDRPNQPRDWLNWYEAEAYCKKIGKRLPTEREWTKAAVMNVTECEKLSKKDAVYQTNRPAEVCSKRENSYGLCDMIGNVGEWVSDGDKSGKQKIILGGSCQSCMADDVFDMRHVTSPKTRMGGIRCAQDIRK